MSPVDVADTCLLIRSAHRKCAKHKNASDDLSHPTHCPGVHLFAGHLAIVRLFGGSFAIMVARFHGQGGSLRIIEKSLTLKYPSFPLAPPAHPQGIPRMPEREVPALRGGIPRVTQTPDRISWGLGERHEASCLTLRKERITFLQPLIGNRMSPRAAECVCALGTTLY